jgi:hypothetical protein
VFVGQVMIASRCPRRPARAARWPHPPRAARALGPPRRWRVEARDAQRPGETRRYRWGCPDPAPSVTAPRIRGTSNAAQDSIHRPVEGAPGARLTRSTGRRSARWATAAGRAAAAGKAAAGWRAVPAAAPRAPTGAAGRRWGFCCGAACCCRGCSHEPCRPDRCCWVIEARCRWSEQMIGYSAAVLIVLPGVERAREDASWRRGSPERP